MLGCGSEFCTVGIDASAPGRKAAGKARMQPDAFARNTRRFSMLKLRYIGALTIAALFATALAIDAADARGRGGGGGGMRGGGGFSGGGMRGGGGFGGGGMRVGAGGGRSFAGAGVGRRGCRMCTALQDLRSGVADLHQARGRARVLSVETPLPARYARHPLPQAGEGKAHRALIHLDALLTDHRCPAREIAVDLRFEL